MVKRVFAVVGNVEEDLNSDDKGVFYIPLDSVVEIMLGEKGGLDEFVLADSNQLLNILYKGKTYLAYKDSLKDFWLV